MISIIILAVMFILSIGFFVLLKQFLKLRKEKNLLQEKYKPIIDIDEYKEKARSELENVNSEISELRKDYNEKRSYYNDLQKEIRLYEDKQEIASFGLYSPHFDFDTSEKYKAEILEIREREKQMVKNEQAAICSTSWTVNGSVAEGKKQTKQYIKLMLRAFNGECDAMIADVRWDNITKMEARLEKSFEMINKMGEPHSTSISRKYRDLKIDELRLTYEYQDKLHDEKEEQKMIKEQMREEERAQKEIEKALKDSKTEEERYKKALEQARIEMEKAQGDKLEQLRAKMEKLQAELIEAQEASQRAVSMAQQTKIGHVYVISNIGSFGENIYKIGMTRRLDPMDRVRELGDASVPFEFDVHAMIKSDNAPELETAFHKYFESKRVNLVNPRKEFFNVTLDEIEKFAHDNNIDIEFTKLAEARDYRESIAIRKSQSKSKNSDDTNTEIKLPQNI